MACFKANDIGTSEIERFSHKIRIVYGFVYHRFITYLHPSSLGSDETIEEI